MEKNKIWGTHSLWRNKKYIKYGRWKRKGFLFLLVLFSFFSSRIACCIVLELLMLTFPNMEKYIWKLIQHRKNQPNIEWNVKFLCYWLRTWRLPGLNTEHTLRFLYYMTESILLLIICVWIVRNCVWMCISGIVIKRA